MIELYTDGATSNNGYEGSIGGWAWIYIKDDKIVAVNSGRIEPATNNICELTAIIEACNFASKQSNSDDLITIYSDSAYCINCYREKWYRKWQNNGWINSKKAPVANKELWLKLIPFFEDSRFNFVKVKGHSTNQYNIVVDTLAVKARS